MTRIAHSRTRAFAKAADVAKYYVPVVSIKQRPGNTSNNLMWSVVVTPTNRNRNPTLTLALKSRVPNYHQNLMKFFVPHVPLSIDFCEHRLSTFL